MEGGKKIIIRADPILAIASGIIVGTIMSAYPVLGIVLLLAIALYFFVEIGNGWSLIFIWRLIVFLLFVVFGSNNYLLSASKLDYNGFENYYGRNFNISGRVFDDPGQNARYQSVPLELISTKDTEARLRLMMTIPLYPPVGQGDRIEAECRINKPEAVGNFRYDEYLAKQGIYAVCFYPKNLKIETGRKSWLEGLVVNLKKSVGASLTRLYPEPSASLAKALIIGDKNGLSVSLKEDFAFSGISHIVAISGLHLGLVAVLLFYISVTIGFWRPGASIVTAVMVWFYTALVGFPASAVRAALMLGIGLLALASGRYVSLGRVLTITVAVILAADPVRYLNDVGFQLSVTAVSAIALTWPLIMKLEGFIRPKIARLAVSSIVLTCAIQIATAPLSFMYFKTISLVAPVTNLLLVWCLPFLMMMIGVSCLLELTPIGQLVAFFAYKTMTAFIFISSVLAKMPYGHIDLRQ